MSLQVELKLRLCKERKTVRIKYNTFEKATYDEYLVCSAILICGTKEIFDKYVDDITGDGSLNSHFKKLYLKYSDLSKEELEQIMSNSMIPSLKIDESNWYDYYPQLNISVYKKSIYNGDLMGTEESERLFVVDGDIIERSLAKQTLSDKAEPYLIHISDTQQITIDMFKQGVSITGDLFSKIVENNLVGLPGYKGAVQEKCDGEGWKIVTAAFLGTLISEKNVVYDKERNTISIKATGIQRTVISRLFGLYVYKQSSVQYRGNPALCEKVVEQLWLNGNLSEMNNTFYSIMFENVSNESCLQKIINAVLTQKNDRSIVQKGIMLLHSGLTKEWTLQSLNAFLKDADRTTLNLLYRVEPTLNYTIVQLTQINKELLSPKHLKQVKEYNQNIQQIRNEIITIIGEITTSGLRERSKVLPSDETTKKFSKLCNKLIGHETKDLENASLETIKKWQEDALELKQLSIEIENKLNELK